MSKYPILFSPLRVGQLTLKNRIVMAPMGSNLASVTGELTNDFIAYYKERAKGGAGLIVIEVTMVDPVYGRSGASGPRADDVKYALGWSRLAQAIHPYGAKVIAQLQHPGNQTKRAFNEGRDVLSPSGIPCKVQPDAPRAMTTEEIRNLVGRFITAATILKKAGLDGVELHGAHGYLISQFFSPYTNRRDDAYGGSFDNRMRFCEEIIQGIRRTCGDSFLISLRMNVEENTPYGYGLEEGVRIGEYFSKHGVDLISASNATYESMEKNLEAPKYEQGWRIYLAEAVKKVSDVPVVGVGALREPEVIEQILSDGKCDLAAIGRGWIAEPYWVEKVRTGREDELRKCICCCHCFEELNSDHIVTCAINPEKGHEFEYGPLRKDGNGRTMVVVGGGPGGMECAAILAERGFRVVLMEQKEKLGGQLHAASGAYGKEKIRWYLQFLESRLKRTGVEIRVGCRATKEVIQAEDPYAVFIATGAQPRIPNIQVMGSDHVMTAENYLEAQECEEKENVVVIGGGMTGCETAVTAAKRGAKVTLVVRSVLCRDVFIVNKIAIMEDLKQFGVDIITGYSLSEICPDGVWIGGCGKKEMFVPADRVLLAFGMRSEDELYKEIAGSFEKCFLIGDAQEVSSIAHATHTAHILARNID